MEKAKRLKWKDRTPENDIGYGGYLSYRHIRIIGWLCMALAQVGVVLGFAMKINPANVASLERWQTAFNFFSALPVPLFMLANLSVILSKKGDWKKLFITYGGLAFGLYVLANFIVMHFVFRAITAFGVPYEFHALSMSAGALLAAFGHAGYTLNIFIDLLLICLLFFFMNYEPKSQAFAGKRVYLFRLMAILPFAYEIIAVVTKFRIATGSWQIPHYVFFLLPSKPPFIFLAFAVVAVALRIAQYRYLKRPGKTVEDWEVYTQTKAHSLKVSIMISVVFLVTSLLDLVTFFLILILYAMAVSQSANPEAAVQLGFDALFAAGFGEAIVLILVIPLVILYSYRKQHKNPKIDLFLPVGGILLIALVYVEGLFQVVICNASSFIQRLQEWIKSIVGGEGGEGGEPAALKAFNDSVVSLIGNIRLH